MSASVLENYHGPQGRFDEMLFQAGEARDHWSFFVDSIDRLGVAELIRRRDEINRLLGESGVTYNVYESEEDEDDGLRERPWSLDPIPNLVQNHEWNTLEKGLAQRAALLDLILRDLYGPRDLLRKGLIPPDVIFAHGGFLRSCQGITRGGRFLHLYAADLARLPSGEFIVMGDRTQAPSGAGYALENRIVLSRVLPGLFRDSHADRLAGFFRSLREALVAAAPDKEDPRVVLLTPGPRSETYFEHAFLAGYLGYPLVQGADLTAREGKVWFNAVDGRRRVDVILRRLDDLFADPLELRPDSLLGVPGLLHSVRTGQVAMLNPPGSGLLENPGLLPFLPELSRELLGEDLRLPSVPTLWCGRKDELEHVVNHLEEYVIQPLSSGRSDRTIHPRLLNSEQREDLVGVMKRRPYAYVAQEIAPLSTLPTLIRDRIEPRSMILRTYLVARENDFHMMPGGLTRVARESDSNLVSGQQGGISKDTWVIASEPRREPTLITGEPAGVVQRGGADVARHAAENLFWLGRYTERAENTLRLQREILRWMVDMDDYSRNQGFPILLVALRKLTTTFPDFTEEPGEPMEQPEREVLDLIYDPARAGTLAFNLRAALQAGREVQDLLAEDAWRILNSLRESLPARENPERVLEDLQRTLTRLSAFGRLAEESMVRVLSYYLFDMGRRLERALNSISLIGSVWNAPGTPDGFVLERLLAVQMSLRTFRWRYPSGMGEAAVLDLLLLDETNPRSVAFQLAAMESISQKLPNPNTVRSREDRLVLEALSLLRLTDPGLLAEDSEDLHAIALEGLVGRINRLLREFSETLHTNYLSRVEVPRIVVERL